MLCVKVTAVTATCRKIFANYYAESYDYIPFSTLYGMLLSLVGEHDSTKHFGVKLAVAYNVIPQKNNCFKKMSRVKYGEASKQFDKKNKNIYNPAIGYAEYLSNIELICGIDSSNDKNNLEQMVRIAIKHPELIDRSGVLYLGSTDDLIDCIKIVNNTAIAAAAAATDAVTDDYIVKITNPNMQNKACLDLPVFVDHNNWQNTNIKKFGLKLNPRTTAQIFDDNDFVTIDINNT